MHQLISPTQKLVPLLKKVKRPILLPHNGKMVPHVFSKKQNKVVPITK